MLTTHAGMLVINPFDCINVTGSGRAVLMEVLIYIPHSSIVHLPLLCPILTYNYRLFFGLTPPAI